MVLVTAILPAQQGYCWVEGDNVELSADSRTRYGPVCGPEWERLHSVGLRARLATVCAGGRPATDKSCPKSARMVDQRGAASTV